MPFILYKFTLYFKKKITDKMSGYIFKSRDLLNKSLDYITLMLNLISYCFFHQGLEGQQVRPLQDGASVQRSGVSTVSDISSKVESPNSPLLQMCSHECKRKTVKSI